MTDTEIALVQQSFGKVAPIAAAAADMFYADLFATAPEVKPYFEGADMSAQGQKLMTTLGMVVRGLNDPDLIGPAVRALALKHVDYGVVAEDYAKVGASLLRTLEQGLGADFTPDVKAAWGTAYDLLAGAMIEAAAGGKEVLQ